MNHDAYIARYGPLKLEPCLTNATRDDLATWLSISGESLDVLVADWLTAYANKHKAEIEEYRAFVTKYRKGTKS